MTLDEKETPHGFLFLQGHQGSFFHGAYPLVSLLCVMGFLVSSLLVLRSRKWKSGNHPVRRVGGTWSLLGGLAASSVALLLLRHAPWSILVVLAAGCLVCRKRKFHLGVMIGCSVVTLLKGSIALTLMPVVLSSTFLGPSGTVVVLLSSIAHFLVGLAVTMLAMISLHRLNQWVLTHNQASAEYAPLPQNEDPAPPSAHAFSPPPPYFQAAPAPYSHQTLASDFLRLDHSSGLADPRMAPMPMGPPGHSIQAGTYHPAVPPSAPVFFSHQHAPFFPRESTSPPAGPP